MRYRNNTKIILNFYTKYRKNNSFFPKNYTTINNFLTNRWSRDANFNALKSVTCINYRFCATDTTFISNENCIFKQAILNPSSVEEAKQSLAELISAESRLILIKGTPETPMCGFSAQVLRIMESRNMGYTYVNVLRNDFIRLGAKELSNWPTFPQVYENGSFVGGCDIVTELYSGPANG